MPFNVLRRHEPPHNPTSFEKLRPGSPLGDTNEKAFKKENELSLKKSDTDDSVYTVVKPDLRRSKLKHTLKCSYDKVRAFDHNRDNNIKKTTLYVVLEQQQQGPTHERRILIFYANAKELDDALEPASTLTPRSFEPADVCFGPDDKLFVADGTMPRVVVFKIESEGKVWECLRTITVVAPTASPVSKICIGKFDGHLKLWVKTSNDDVFRCNLPVNVF
jgi:hypothetical protein